MRVIFITGTDTGVGKTVLTALLLSHLRRKGRPAFALKPFCSGGREDAEGLHALQNRDLSLDEVNPFHFPEPIAPLVAARNQGRSISLEEVLAHILRVAKRVSHLDPTILIEGAGGLLSPLAENVSAREIISRLARHQHSRHSRMRQALQFDLEVIVVARNALGTVNHTLLTLDVLRAPSSRNGKKRTAIPSPRVVLMNHGEVDHSSKTNLSLLRELCPGTRILECPHLPGGAWNGRGPTVPRMLELILDSESKSRSRRSPRA